MYNSLDKNVKKLHIREGAESKKLTSAQENAIRNAVRMINNWMFETDVDLLDIIDMNTETYYFVDDYTDGSGQLDAESIIDEYRETFDPMSTYDPRDYLFNILREIVGMGYDDAEKFLKY